MPLASAERARRILHTQERYTVAVCPYVFGAGSKYEKNIFPRTWIEQSVEIRFEDGVFPISAHYDELLTRLYGDYRVLPSPEERKCKEHAAILDLEHSYTAHLPELDATQFDVLTKSIR